MGASHFGLRMGKMKAGPVVTDNGMFVIDAVFSPAQMSRVGEVRPRPSHAFHPPLLSTQVMLMHARLGLSQLLTKIKMLTGVVEVGLFVGMAKAAYFGNEDGSVMIRWANGRVEKVEPLLSA